MKKHLTKKSRIVYLCMVLLVVLLNAAAWNSTAFSDWYIAHIFPIWVNLYGRITGLFPFSVGEWLIAAGLVVVAVALLLGIAWAVVGVVLLCSLCLQKVRGVSSGKAPLSAKKAFPDAEEALSGAQKVSLGARKALPSIGHTFPGRGFQKFSRGFYRFFAWTLLAVCLVMTLNCFILYHAATFSEHYFGAEDGEYDLVELIEVYNMVAEQCNALALEIERDDNGRALYTDSVGRKGETLDMADKARELMQQLGETYPQLDGFYPRPKALLSSDFMCQQYMQGYYFPFSMEANYNDVMYILNIPSTMCHELAHLRGYIFEDEASFISYLACVQSDDAFFQYAGYLSVLTYLNNDLYKAYNESRTAYEEAVAQVQPIAVDAQVWADNIFVVPEEWDRINSKALLDTEVVDAAADVFIDVNLKVNGVSDGKVSYSRVVRLLLQYYQASEDNFDA